MARSAKVLGYCVLLALFALSLAVRSSNIWDRPLLSHDEDATGHVLATLQGMQAAPVAIHKYLPIITLSQNAADRGIDNFVAASLVDARGNHFYVSFPPIGFAAPAMLFKALGVQSSVIALRLLCAALGLLTGTLFYLLCLRLLCDAGMPDKSQAAIALCLSSLMLFNSESLWIFGNVYWHHVMLEPILVAILLVLAHLLERPNTAKGVALIALLLMACTVEWAAFPLAAGVTLLGLHHLVRGRPGGAWILAAGIIGPLVGIAIIAWHFSQVAGFQAYLHVLQNRPGEHGWKNHALIQAVVALLPIYLPMIMLGIVLFRTRTRTRTRIRSIRQEQDQAAHWQGVVLPVLFCAAAGAIESIVLIKHTAKYTYGSLPLTTLLILLLLVLILRFGANLRLLAWGTGISMAAWLGVYFVQNPPGLAATEFGRQFESLGEIRKRAAPDEVVFTNIYVPLGLPLGVTGRNLTGTPELPRNLPLAGMQAHLVRTGNTRGKLFLYDIEREPVGNMIWWAYTKSRVVGTADRRYGPLAALVTFDAHRILSIQVRPEPRYHRVLDDWRAGRDVVHLE